MTTEEINKKAEELFPYNPTISSQITDKLRGAFLLGYGIGKEKMNDIIRVDKYGCKVDYTCDKLNSMQSLIEFHLNDNKVVQKSLLDLIERVRVANSELRDWGHNLRGKLLKIYNVFNETDLKQN
jgi:hypothetical protein